MKELVIYFSRKGNNYVNGSICDLKEGNVEKIVDMLSEGMDRFEVERKKDYSKVYKECVNESVKELKENERPELKNMLGDISNYEVIYIVGPCWCGHYPMPLATQLEHLDFNGKKVRYIMSHEGSGLANAKKDLSSWCEGAEILDGLSVKGSEITKNELMEWRGKSWNM